MSENRKGKKYPTVEGIYVQDSSIHGKGCFAARRFKKGDHIGNYEGPSTMKDGIYVLWVSDDGQNWSGINGKNELRYLNHKAKCNAAFDGNKLFATRTIKPDEEITFHYGEEWEGIP